MPSLRSLTLILVQTALLGVMGTHYAHAAEQATFRAGVAKANITPWLGISINGGMRDRIAASVHDELHARCVVLDDGQTQLAIVVCDSCLIPREVFDAAKRRAEQQCGIPASHVLASATHTHSAPSAASAFQSDADPRYQELLKEGIARAIVEAVGNLQPAKIGWGFGKVPSQVFNRRWYMKPGTIPPGPFADQQDKVKMNPPRASADLLGPAGPIDPTLSIVSVQTANGEPLAVLGNYSLHYVGGTAGPEISADYFGMFATKVAALLGKGGDQPRDDADFLAMLSNGTSGDINNINFQQPYERRQPYEQMEIVANEVAKEAVRVVGEIEHRSHARLAVANTVLQLGVRKPSEKDLIDARKIVSAAESPIMRTLPEVYAREALMLQHYPEKVEVPLQAFRIGEVAVAAIPCEVFVEIGLELREKSPLPHQFTIELANGYNGYLPTPKHHKLGGYETWRARSSYLEEEASPKIVDAMLELFEQVRE